MRREKITWSHFLKNYTFLADDCEEMRRTIFLEYLNVIARITLVFFYRSIKLFKSILTQPWHHPKILDKYLKRCFYFSYELELICVNMEISKLRFTFLSFRLIFFIKWNPYIFLFSCIFSERFLKMILFLKSGAILLFFHLFDSSKLLYQKSLFYSKSVTKFADRTMNNWKFRIFFLFSFSF